MRGRLFSKVEDPTTSTAEVKAGPENERLFSKVDDPTTSTTEVKAGPENERLFPKWTTLLPAQLRSRPGQRMRGRLFSKVDDPTTSTAEVKAGPENERQTVFQSGRPYYQHS